MFSYNLKNEFSVFAKKPEATLVSFFFYSDSSKQRKRGYNFDLPISKSNYQWTLFIK